MFYVWSKDKLILKNFSIFWLICLVNLTIFSFPEKLVFANTYAVAESQYRAGDLINAEKSVLESLKTPTTPLVQSESLKLLGIIRYSKGDSQGAERSFKEGLSTNSSLKINQRDVLDPNVIVLFEKVRGRVSQAAARKSKHIEQKNPHLKQGNESRTVRRSIRPTMKVLANLNGGKVMIDGIYAGDTGFALSVDPGNIVFEVMAPGYQTYKGRANVLTRNETVIKITMRKLPLSSPRVAGTTVGGMLARDGGRKPAYRSGSTALGNPKIADNRPRPAKSSEVLRDRPMTTSQVIKSNQFEEPAYKSKDNLPGSVQMNEFDRDLAAVKKRDALRKLAKNQQRVRSRPPVEYFMSSTEKNEIVARQNRTESRPELYNTTIVPGEEAENHSSSDASLKGSENSQGFFTPRSRQNQIAKDSMNIRDANMESIPDPAYKPSGDDSQANVMTILPLGLGQLAQGRYGLGGFLFVMQSGLLVYAYDKTSQADSQEAGLQRFVDLNCSALDVTDERLRNCSNVVDKKYNEVDSLRNQSNYALAGFAVVALGGIIEAMNWEPPRKILKNPSTKGGVKYERNVGLMDSSLNAGDPSGLRLGLTMPTSMQGPQGLGLGLEYRF